MKETISSSKPCKICGKPDYCFRLHHDDGGISHCCAREHDAALLVNGEEYVKYKEKDTNIGTYSYYMTAAERDAFLKKVKAEKNGAKQWKKKEVNFQEPEGDVLIPGEYEIASDDRLDKVYRRFLSLLILEDKDRDMLQAEWNTTSTGNLFAELVKHYDIKSLPPADYIRKRRAYKDGIRNMPRYKICKKLVEELGELEGIPGFYKNDYGWSFTGTEGIFFPLYNKKGQLIRLRLRETYPEIRGVFNGIEGTYKHGYDENGMHTWLFIGKESGQEEVVYSTEKNLISLKQNGCPAGKAASKYKNFSSVYEKKKGDEVVNGYGFGTRSGSNISLYCKPTDDFSVIYVTEGEKKAMVANMLLGVPVISLPGTGTFSKLFEKNAEGISMMDYLVQEKGTKLVVIAYDADKNTNIMVLRSEQKAIMEFLQRGISIAVGEWNAAFGKGLDDILVTGVRPSVYLCA